MALPPKPVAKIITQKVISPLSRSDMSKPKGFPKPKAPEPVEELPPEDKDEALLTQEVEDDFLDSLDEDIPEEPKAPVKKEEKPKPVVKEEKKATKEIQKKAEVEKVPEKRFEEILDSAEDELSFLSSGTKKIEKELLKKEEPKSFSKKEGIFIEPLETPKQIEVTPDFLQKEIKGNSFVSISTPVKETAKANITLNFEKKYESCYIPAEGQSPCNKEANIFLREVIPNSPTYQEVIEAHKETKNSVASPFKFFSKPDFVHIFQKAFLGSVFDLSYSTPYYYTKAGTHHLYLSSQIIEKAKMLHVVLLDVLPKKLKIEETFFADLLDFTIHRAILVSVNALYL